MLKVIEAERQKDIIRRNAKYSNKIFLVFGWLGICLTLLIHLPLIITLLMSNNDGTTLSTQLFALSLSILKSITAIFILFTIASLFKDISNAKSPISEKLVNHLRLLALLLLVIFAIIFLSQFFIPEFSSATSVEGCLEVGVQSDGNSSYINVNFEYLFAALFCYCLSYVFKYTLYLQQSADDTI